MPNDGKTPLERQQEAEKANTRVTDTGAPAEGETVEGDPVPVGTGAPFDPPVGTHEVSDDTNGPDELPQNDLVMRDKAIEIEEEAKKATKAEQAEEKAAQVKDETKSTPAKSTPNKTTSK